MSILINVMSRRSFIEAHGATCRNWRWSWSFVNDKERFVIFGAWDKTTENGRTKILDEIWAVSAKGKRQPGYGPSREHVRLIEEHGYKLFTYRQFHSGANQDKNGEGPALVKGFEPKLTERRLVREGGKWFAV